VLTRSLKSHCHSARALAPYVNRATIKSGSPDRRLCGQIMDEEARSYPVSGKRGAEWFATLQAECGWNSRLLGAAGVTGHAFRQSRPSRDYAGDRPRD